MERLREKTTTLYAGESFTVVRPDLLSPVWKKRVVIAALAGSDVLLALAIWMAAYVMRSLGWQGGGVTGVTILAIAPSVVIWIGLRGLLGLYPGYGLDSVERLRRHTCSVFAVLAMMAVLALGFQVGGMLSRLLIGLAFMGLLFAAPLLRYFMMQGLDRIGAWGKPVIVLSYKDTGVRFVELMKREWGLGYKPVALFDYNLVPAGDSFSEVPYHETLADAEDFARRRGIDTIIFAMPRTRREQLATLVGLARTSFPHVLVVPNLSGITNSAVVARNLGGTLAVEIKHNLLDPWALRTKRVVDFTSTVLGGLAAAPIILVLALMVYLESGGPVFYRDKRMGRDGKLFACVKFRTMVPGAEGLLQRMLEEEPAAREEYAKYHKLRDDPRVTRVGRFLRRTSMDELPQLWNVLMGDMSLVGPRPYLPRESEEIGVTQGEILRVPPGITGPWQVSGRNQTSFQERVDIDAYYVHDWSIWLDIVLLTQTLKIVLRGRGAY